MHGVTEVRGLCGAMGVLKDAEGGLWVESCHVRVGLGCSMQCV
ncbi:Variant-specific surface protein [Giardia duodenalis]|uniref:Variant-specific surface protein n=1 Tax=Giardia intestinalis TaxID=5741 RepID=V6TLG1_GIAIN|nr:Variant-specific surface protein [Giardia intestinalis]